MSLVVTLYKAVGSYDAYKRMFYRAYDNLTTYSQFDASDYLLDDDLVIEQTIEFTQALEGEDSQTHLTFEYNDTLWDWLHDELMLDRDYYQYAIEMTLDGAKILWASIDKMATTHDYINQTMEISTKGWYKTMIDLIGHRTVYSDGTMTPHTVDLTEYLSYIFVNGSVATSINVQVEGASEELDGAFLFELSSNLTIKDFMTEIQKNYGCYFYVDADRVFNVINRGYSSGDKSVSIIDDGYTSYREKGFDSVFCNGKFEMLLPEWFPDDFEPTEDIWVIMYENGDGDLEVQYVASSPSEGYDYLDIRQKLTYNDGTFVEGTEWKLFLNVTIPNTSIPSNSSIYWELYKSLIGQFEVVELTTLGTDFKLFDNVTVGDNDYSVFRVETNFTQGLTSLLLRRKI